MNPIPNNSAGLASALLSPASNWAARSAARDQAVQLSTMLAQQQELALAQQQQAQAAIDQQLAAERNIPFMGADLLALQKHVSSEEKQVYQDLKDNFNGDARKWFAARGQAFMADASTRLLKAPFYQQAVKNRSNIIAAQQARERGETLIGSMTPNGYVRPEQEMLDFLSGKSSTYEHKGSYRMEDGVKELREQLPIGRFPWERVQVADQDVLNHLKSKYGEAVGQDMWERTYRTTPVFHKTESIMKAYDFARDQGRYAMDQTRLGLEKGRYAMAQQDQAMQRGLYGLQREGLQLSNAKKRQELADVGPNGISFDTEFFNYPTSKIDLRHEAGVKKQLPHSGIDVSRVRTLAGRTLFGDSVQPVVQQLGLQRTKEGTYTSGNIREAFSPDNGTGVFDLSKSKFTVQSIEPTLFFDPAEVTPNGPARTGVNGYVRVVAQFKSDADATAAGLYNERWGWLPDGSTKAGSGVYLANDDDTKASTRTATLLVPLGKVNAQHNKPLMKAIQKETMGVSAANKAQVDAPYMPTPNL